MPSDFSELGHSLGAPALEMVLCQPLTAFSLQQQGLKGAEVSRMGNPWEGIWWQGRKQRSSGGGPGQDAAGVFVVPGLSKIQLRY